jgi:2-phosphoglycolate phosphatase
MPRYCLSAVLFDLDGTLLDTAPDLGHALNQVLVRHGMKPVTLEKVRQVASSGSPGLIKLGFGIETIDPDYQHLRQQFIDEYMQHLAVSTTLFPGMAEALTCIENIGLRWGIVTNKSYELSKALINMLGLSARCSVLVGGDTTSTPKPHPAPLQYACQQLNCLPNECVYVGDAPQDIQAAINCQMPSIAALYGYLPEDAKPEHWGAEYYIDKPTDLMTWLEKFVKLKAA